MPKQDSQGFYIDDRSNDLEGAAGFQQYWNDHMWCDDDEADEPDEEDVPDDEDDNDNCNCSDPCCPCDGMKKGTP